MFLSKLIDDVLEENKALLLDFHFYRELVYKLTYIFLDREQFLFTYRPMPFLERSQFAVSGLYDYETNKKIITLNLSSHYRKFNIHHHNWKIFKFCVSQVCQHESIHQLQWQKRDNSTFVQEPIDFRLHPKNTDEEEEKNYLADPDEIDAYAHDIAMEIKFYYPDQNPYSILKHIRRKRKVWSYHYYRNTFKRDDWTEIRRLLLKKTYTWLPHV